MQFDPTGTLLHPDNLRVWRLVGDRYEAVPVGASGGFPSGVLEGLEWLQVGALVRLRDIATGALLPTAAEARLPAPMRKRRHGGAPRHRQRTRRPAPMVRRPAPMVRRPAPMVRRQRGS